MNGTSLCVQSNSSRSGGLTAAARLGPSPAEALHGALDAVCEGLGTQLAGLRVPEAAARAAVKDLVKAARHAERAHRHPVTVPAHVWMKDPTVGKPQSLRHACLIRMAPCTGCFHLYALGRDPAGGHRKANQGPYKGVPMASNPMTKMVTHRDRSTTAVVAAATTHAPVVTQGLAPLLGAEAATAANTLLKASAEHLSKHRDALVAAESAHAAELADDGPARKERDAAIASLRDTVINVREVAPVAASAGYAVSVGLTGATPEDASTLVRQAQYVAGKLSSTPVPPSRLPGYTFPAAEFANQLKTGADRLDAAVKKVAGEGKENAETQLARDNALAAYDEAFQTVANLTTALLEAAGLDELAGKVRPSSRRKGLTAEVEQQADAEAPAQPPQ